MNIRVTLFRIAAKGCLIATLCVMTALGFAPQASGALLAYEGFNYAANSDLSGQGGGTGWGTNLWSSTTGDTVVSYSFLNGSLTYTDARGNRLQTSGNSGYFNGSAGTSSPFRQLGADRGADGTTTWLSFMGYRLGVTTNNGIAAEVNNIYPRAANFSLFQGTGNEQLAIGNSTSAPTNTWALIPDGGLGNIRSSTANFSDLSLVVVRIDHKAGNDDAYMFIDPLLDGGAPSLASARAFSTNGFDFAFNNVRPFAGNPQAQRPYAELLLDEIRIGNTFGDVTPFISVPEPSIIALTVAGAALLGLGWKRRQK